MKSLGKRAALRIYGLIQGSSLDSIEHSEIGVDHHLMVANGQNLGFQEVSTVS